MRTPDATPRTDRRALLMGGAAGLSAGVAALAMPRWARAQAAQSPAPAQAPATPAAGAPPAGPFRLPPLPYAANANEPHIDAQTMELHHGRHHAAFVTNLNNLLRDNAALAQVPMPRLLGMLDQVPEGMRTAIRNNGGGHANHTMFWTIMGGRGGAPSGDLAAAIDRDLGGFEKLKTDFNAAGGRRFGSGWVFVTVTREGRLALLDLPNQDSPWMTGAMPLMGNDVWEHAYYLKYQNRRADYLQAWWNVVNWDAVGQRFAAARAGNLEV